MSTASARILVVDDEPRALELVVRTLRKVGHVETAPSADVARGMLEAGSFDLVISDQRMPGMSGVDLLGFAAERDETCGRILLTGYADLEATVEAINRGRVHAYLHKPCSAEELRAVVQSTLGRARLAKDNARLVAVVTEQNDALRQALASLESAQQRLVASERLAAIGRMIAVIVHDLRTPISVVRSAGGETARLGRELPNDEIVSLGDEVVTESDHMQRICSDMLEVTRVSEGHGSPVATALDDLVEDALAHLIESAARDAVQVVFELRAGVTLPLDADRMRRALRNLAQNALEAMPNGGLLRVATRTDAGAVVISVTDTGCGIPDDIRERVFEPFVTAGKSGGSGLGLAIVRKVVEDHGGAIAIGKPEGGGTAFHLSLPLAAVAGA
jgi:signal transduction histidine kinase